jgi:hypothetical protein
MIEKIKYKQYNNEQKNDDKVTNSMDIEDITEKFDNSKIAYNKLLLIDK